MRFGRWLRFLIGGAINTGISYVIYLVLMQFLQYQYAYVIAYFGGILFSYWFNSRIVFDVPISLIRFLTFPLVYVIQYASSAIFLYLFVEFLRINKIYAPLATSAIMIPVTYAATKVILYGKQQTKALQYHMRK
jgi:putative flippase GtrA